MRNNGAERARSITGTASPGVLFLLGAVALVLAAAASAPPEHPSATRRYGQRIDQKLEKLFSSTYKIIAEYSGEYICLQGRTKLSLQVLKASTEPAQVAIFNFGGRSGDSRIPRGSYLVQGHIDLHGGVLDLSPLAWIEQPAGYVMVGLAGRSDDGGDTFTGTITGGYRCGAFFLQLSH